MSAAVAPLCLIICVLVANPVSGTGVNDDWSYAWSARDLATTGSLHYNGWATAMLGWQLYLAVIAIKLFGFSFTALRASVLLIALCTSAIIQRLFVRFGVSEWNSTVATLAVVLTPTFQQLSFSFMTDIPGLFVLLGCIYACIFALSAKSDAGAIAWLSAAAVSNIFGGSVRQISWLGLLVVLPSTSLYLRRRRKVLVAGAFLWLLGILSIALQIRWFQRQPYSIAEPVFFKTLPLLHLPILVLTAFSLGLMILGVLLAFITKTPGSMRRQWTYQIPVAALLTVFASLYERNHVGLSNFPFLGNLVSQFGIEAIDLTGIPPTVIPFFVRAFLAFLFIFATMSAVTYAWHLDWQDGFAQPGEGQLSGTAKLVLLGPLFIAYLGLILLRNGMYDRYLIPIEIFVLIPLLLMLQARAPGQLGTPTLVAIAVYAMFGSASIHDMYATDRARNDVFASLISKGIPDKNIHAGMANDTWTELSLTGHVDDPRMRLPPGSHFTPPAPGFAYPCSIYSAFLTPDVKGPYVLTYEELPCFRSSGFSPVPYRTWLPPYHRSIHIQMLP